MSDEPDAEQPIEAATEEPKADAEFPGQMLDKMLTTLDSIGKICDGLGKRMDAMEKRADAAPGTPRQVAADSEPKGFLERQEAERKDAAEKASVQSRADGVYMSLGQQSPAPMAGEKLQAYRARLARGLQRHSPGFKGVDLTTLPSGIAFDSVENRIYADAFEASKTPEVIPGVLREIVKVDVGGRRVSTFHGDHTFISHLSRPSRRVVGINTKGRE